MRWALMVLMMFWVVSRISPLTEEHCRQVPPVAEVSAITAFVPESSATESCCLICPIEKTAEVIVEPELYIPLCCLTKHDCCCCESTLELDEAPLWQLSWGLPSSSITEKRIENNRSAMPVTQVYRHAQGPAPPPHLVAHRHIQLLI